MRLWNLIFAAALIGGCAKGPELEPAPGARAADGTAMDSDAGVSVMVDPDDWYGISMDAPELVKLHVEIDNNSGRPLLLNYDHFALVGDNGRTWRAIDPRRPDMIDLDLGDELLEVSAVEREVEDTVDGYLYFEAVTTNQVRFDMDLVDARTGETFGNVSIPFIVTQRDEDQMRGVSAL